jgi:hypothetical protein
VGSAPSHNSSGIRIAAAPVTVLRRCVSATSDPLYSVGGGDGGGFWALTI